MALTSLDTVKTASPVRIHSGSVPAILAETDNASARVATGNDNAKPLRRGLSNWNPQLNTDISDAQRALDFLDQSAARLQNLKQELSAKLTGRLQQPGILQKKLRQFDSLWQQRQSVTGGNLDPQLQYCDKSVSSQSFTVSGLSMQTLQSGAKETFTFSVGAGQPLRSVIVEPGLSQDEIVQRFDQALAPAQIRVSKDEDGAMVFSVAESSWSSLRETLALKGDGIRFPTGQLNRVRAEAKPAVVQPETWRVGDIESIRNTLQQVVQAINQVNKARLAVSRALDEAVALVNSAQSPESNASVAQLAQKFVVASGQSDYQAYSTVITSIMGISRSRVLSLLSLQS